MRKVYLLVVSFIALVEHLNAIFLFSRSWSSHCNLWTQLHSSSLGNLSHRRVFWLLTVKLSATAFTLTRTAIVSWMARILRRSPYLSRNLYLSHSPYLSHNRSRSINSRLLLQRDLIGRLIYRKSLKTIQVNMFTTTVASTIREACEQKPKFIVQKVASNCRLKI